MENGFRGWKGLEVSTACTFIEVHCVDWISVGVDICQNRFTRPTNSNGRCWMRGRSRRRGGGNTRDLERPSQRRRRKRWSFANRPSSIVPWTITDAISPCWDESWSSKLPRGVCLIQRPEWKKMERLYAMSWHSYSTLWINSIVT